MTLVTGPASEPVTLAEAKAHLRVDGTDEETLISSLIVATRQYAERYMRRALINQTWRYDADQFEDRIQLWPAPVSSITSVTYVDSAGSTVTVSSSDYQADLAAEPAILMPSYAAAVWPLARPSSLGSIRVTFVAGYGSSASSVPTGIKQAILLLIGHWFANREITSTKATELPFAVSALLDNYQVPALR